MYSSERNKSILKMQIIVLLLVDLFIIFYSIDGIKSMIVTSRYPDEQAIIIDMHEGDRYGRPYYTADTLIDGEEYVVYIDHDMYRHLDEGDSFTVRYDGENYVRFNAKTGRVANNILGVVVVTTILVLLIGRNIKEKAKENDQNI